MNKLYALPALAIAVASCATMSDATYQGAGFGRIEDRVASFDNTREVSLTPAFLARPDSDLTWAPTLIGAEWSAKAPTEARITIKSNGVPTNYTGLSINIDGAIRSYKTSALTLHDTTVAMRMVTTDSHNQVAVPLETLRAMVAAKDCRIRFHTVQGDQDALCHKDQIAGISLARARIAAWLATVDGKKD